jgi:uncharacterized membrane protein YciS (DUF1049 family)
MKIEINVNDRVVSFVRRLFKGKYTVITIAAILFCFGVVLFSEQLKEWYIFSPGQKISSEQVNQNFKRLYDKVNQLGIGVPTGTIVAYWGTAAPEGWILCDGRPVPDGSDYDILRINVGTNVPDLRGQFLRGLDAAGTVDPDGATRGGVGSKEDDALQEHQHNYLDNYVNSEHEFACSGAGCTLYRGPADHGRITGNSVGGKASTETRPKNVAVNFIIKY